MIVAKQAHLFACMMMTGALLGAAHDMLALLRHACSAGPALTGAADLSLGLLAAGGMIACGLALRENPFRLFAFAGVAVGLAAYFCTLGACIRCLTGAFLKLIKKREKIDGKCQKVAGK